MGILGRLFGGNKKQETKKKQQPRRSRGAAPPVARRPPPGEEGSGESQSLESKLTEVDDMSAKELARKIGSSNVNVRHAIEKRLGELGDRSAMRPLINAYLMNGDVPALDALRGFGKALTVAMRDLASDVSNSGERRARIMDILAVTGDDAVLPAVREAVEAEDPLVRTRACAALVALGDLHGVARLDQDLQTNDAKARMMALDTLLELKVPEASKCIEEHVERYLADAGAIPPIVTVTAPRLADPQLKLHDVVLDSLQSSEHGLTIVIGSEAINYATARRNFFEEKLEGIDVRFGTRRMAPEEQIAELQAARTAAGKGKRAVFIGAVPTPASDPPLPHVLQPTGDGPFTAKIMIVDPHEFAVGQSWWYYVMDKGDVPTDFEVMLGASRPGISAISDEEFDIWQKLDDEQSKARFTRALLARM